MGKRMKNKKLGAFLIGLFVTSLMVFTGTSASLQASDICDAESGDTCTISSSYALNGDTLNYSGTVNFESGASLTGGGDIYADEFTGLNNLDLENGDTGNFYLCERTGGVTCRPESDSGVSLDTSYELDSSRFLFRQINDNWSSGYVNWTDDLSRTSDLNSSFSDMEVNYTVSGLTENLDFKIFQEGSQLTTQDSGINFSHIINRSFTDGTSSGLTTGNSLRLKASSTSVADIASNHNGDETSSPNNYPFRNRFSPTNTAYINGVWLASGYETDMSYNITNIDTGRKVVSGTHFHSGGFPTTDQISYDFQLSEFETVKLNSSDTYEVAWSADDSQGYYGGSIPYTDSGIEWTYSNREAQDGNAWNVGVNIIDGYQSSGAYTSQPLDAGEKIDWNSSYVDISEPESTSINTSFAENTSNSGTWTYYDSIKNVPDSRYIKYKIEMSTEDSSITPVVDSIDISFNPNGQDGVIEVSQNITGENKFEVLETTPPSYTSQTQGKNIVGAQNYNTLSSTIQDSGSGLRKAVLATNETGSMENKTSYTQNFNGEFSEQTASFDWKNSSFQGDFAEIEWQIWFSDIAGNWQKTSVKQFKVDGIPPEISNLDYQNTVDVDEGSTQITFDVTESETDLNSVIIRENSTGGLENTTLTSPYSYTLSTNTPSEVDFTVFAEDTKENVEQSSGTVSFQNISITKSLNASVVNSSEAFEISGSAVLRPYGTALTSDLDLWADIEGWTNLGSISPVDGAFSRVETIKKPGTHEIKLNTTQNGIYGVSEGSIDVLLDINTVSTVFDSTGNSHVDIDTSNKNLNLSANISRPVDGSVQTVIANVSMPDGTYREFELGTNEGHTWYREIDTDQEFGSLQGEYSVTFSAETTEGLGSNLPAKSFYIENITVDSELSDSVVSIGEDSEISGNVILRPYGERLDGGSVEASKGSFSSDFPVNGTGYYSGSVFFDEPGNKTVNLQYVDENGIKGVNSTEISVLNLSARITDVSTDNGNLKVFRDSDSEPDVSFTDNVSADTENPMPVREVDLIYDRPEGWQGTYSSSVGNLSPGEYGSVNPVFDIEAGAELGVKNISISTSTQEDIQDTDNVSVEVWTRSESEYVNLDYNSLNSINRNLELYSIYANVTDTVNGEPLENIDVQLISQDESIDLTETSNSTGGVNFTLDLSQLSTGEYGVSMRTFTNEQEFVETSETVSSNLVDIAIQGVMQKGTQNSIDPVYRSNDSVQPTTGISGIIEDSTGNPLEGATVTGEINGEGLGEKQTDSNGYYGFSYNPPDNIQPGNYAAELEASKTDFKTFNFNRTVEVRGALNLNNNLEKNVLGRGLSHNVVASVTNEYGENVPGNVSWFLNSTKVGSGKNTEIDIPESFDRGFYTLEASTDRDFFDDDSDSVDVNVYGQASVEMTPEDFTIRSGNTVTFEASVTDDNSSQSISDYPVTFEVNGQTYERTTNNSGIATFDWTSTTGEYDVEASINDNASLNYNATDSNDVTEVFVGDKLYLDTFRFSENVINRFPETPDQTRIRLNLTRTSNTIERVPVSNEEVSFTVNGSETVSCTTGEDGTCGGSLWYNPTDAVTPGNLTVQASTDRSNWIDVSDSRKLAVRGLMITSLESPADGTNLARGDSVQLEAVTDTFSGGIVERDMTWTLDGTEIASGYTTSWDIPVTQDTGVKTLTATGDGEFFDSSSDSIDITILGQASVNLLEPDNSSTIGYSQNRNVRCEVVSGLDSRIQGYPVEFVENSSGVMETFAQSVTENTGSGLVAEASWSPPEKITSVEMGCRIDTNETLGYLKDQGLSTRIYETEDDSPPEISNLQVPDRVDPGEVADIEFNASDEIGIDRIDVQVLDPVFNELGSDDINIVNTTGTGYRVEVQTQSSTQGTYRVDLEIFDPSGNSKELRRTFDAQPGGNLNIDNKNIDAGEITFTEGLTEEVGVSFQKEENDGANLKINVSSSVLDFNTSEYVCGDINPGNYCNRTFEVTVPPGTSPTGSSPIYASFRAVWDKTDGTDETASIGDFTEVNVARNPQFSEETGEKIITGLSDSSTAINTSDINNAFRANSSGNVPVQDYEVIYHEENLPEEWLTVYNGERSSIDPGQVVDTDVGINITDGTGPGNYTGLFEFRSSNYGNITRVIAINLDARPEFEAPEKISASAVRGSSGSLGSLKLNSTGNVDLSLEAAATNNAGVNSTCAKNIGPATTPVTLEKQSSKVIDIQYNFSDVTLNSNSCTPKIEFTPEKPEYDTSQITEFSISLLDFTLDASADEVSAMPGDEAGLNFTANIGDSPRTTNLDYTVFVGGKEASITDSSITGDGFSLNYTVPDVEDARSHDVRLEVYDEENGVSQSQVFRDYVSVPDVTPPDFGEVDIDGVNPGEDQDIRVPVIDNSIDGVQSISMTLNGENFSESYSLVEDGPEWITTVENISEGIYTANFTAVDPSGLESTASDRFRVSESASFNGSFTSSAGDVNSDATITLSDSSTGRTVSSKVGEDGSYSLDIKTGTYDLNVAFEGQKITMNNTLINSSNMSFRAEKLSEAQTSGLTPSSQTSSRITGIGVDTSLEPESSEITFNYSGLDLPDGYQISELKVARCGEYDYSNLRCNTDSFEVLDLEPLDVNKARETITVDTDGFSSYTLFAPSEDTGQDQNNNQEQDSGGGGGGGGSFPEDALNDINDSVSETKEKVENLSGRLNDTTETPGAELGSSSINAELRPGESMTVSLSVANTANDSQTFIFDTNDVVRDYIDVTDSVTLAPGESRDVILNISSPADELAGSYSGTLSVESDEINTEIPVNVQILPPQNKLLDMSLDPVFSTVRPGEALQIETTFSNQGYARNVDVTAKIDVIDPDTNASIASISETVAVGTTLNRVFEIDIPRDTELKSYAIRGSARYTNLDVARVATAASSIEIDMPFWSRTFFGFTYQNIGLGFLLLLLVSSTGLGLYHYKRKKELQKKRYMENIDLDTIPTGGNNQAYLGQLAEVGTRTFLNLDDLTTHALIAGATGSGKTVTGQVMVEEALENGANVIVLDPTAQWTGYLRENQDENMFELYDKFGLSRSDARGFDGNIRAVEPGEEIDITPYLEQDEDGQIIVFSLHKLDSKNIDEFANKTIQQIFDANLPERNGLETVIVYDEVHRLLEKFGGNGEGIKQLERGAREFRKWGVGMVLLSQVISDFSGEIRANIGTTVQMRTQYDDDLERIKNKFGIDTVKSIAKAEVGSGMLQSSDYNHGRPYFIDFRPLLHSPHRLSDEELDKYEQYNKRIDSIEEKVNELEDQGEEVYEYRSELKLTKRNLKKGSFSLVDTYIDELEEKLDM
ncbi:helicase HerA domain-containing protein [Candidatus Nanosalina sp. VS9-1]|uniref:helicase HerA domain-containing protein n=1 Tax=Candidatus Nanosalina sp. VS9-1 TaxID=3388566 RepID=UPI0039E162CC